MVLETESSRESTRAKKTKGPIVLTDYVIEIENCLRILLDLNLP